MAAALRYANRRNTIVTTTILSIIAESWNCFVVVAFEPFRNGSVWMLHFSKTFPLSNTLKWVNINWLVGWLCCCICCVWFYLLSLHWLDLISYIIYHHLYVYNLYVYMYAMKLLCNQFIDLDIHTHIFFFGVSCVCHFNLYMSCYFSLFIDSISMIYGVSNSESNIELPNKMQFIGFICIDV